MTEIASEQIQSKNSEKNITELAQNILQDGRINPQEARIL